MAADPSALRTLDTDDLERTLHCGVANLLKLLNSGAPPSAKVGARWLVWETDLLVFVERAKPGRRAP